MAVNYGSKRTVVGAHYGLRDWLVQRGTAGLMAVYTVLLLGQVLLAKGPINYVRLASIFAQQWMKVLTFAVILALVWHAWVGVRDIFMDYVQPVGSRLLLQIVFIVLFVCCSVLSFQVLWRL